MDGTKVCHDAMMADNANNDRNKVRLSGAYEAFMMRLSRGGPDDPNKTQYAKMFEAWTIHRDEILRIWKVEKRKGEPYGAKMFDGK